jgi:biotin carboxyl carrier protein
VEFRYQINDDIHTIQIERDGERYRVVIGDRTYNVSMQQSASGVMQINVDGERHTAIVAQNGSMRYVSIDGKTFELAVPAPGRAGRRHHGGEDSLTASMPGQVIKLLVAADELVERGQTLVILEAMKMEIRVSAPHGGRVADVYVKEGQVVDRGQRLVELSE